MSAKDELIVIVSAKDELIMIVSANDELIVIVSANDELIMIVSAKDELIKIDGTGLISERLDAKEFEIVSVLASAALRERVFSRPKW